MAKSPIKQRGRKSPTKQKKKVNKTPKHDRSNIGPDGLSKDEQYRRSLKAKEKGESKPTEANKPIVSRRCIQFPDTYGNSVAQGILYILRCSQSPFAICQEVDNESSPELSRFHSIFLEILDWSSRWGGIVRWSLSLDECFEEAQKEGREHDLCLEAWEYAERGRKLQACISELRGTLPASLVEVKELYRREVEANQLLVRGITIIETRVSVLCDRCTVGSLDEDLLPSDEPEHLDSDSSVDSLSAYS
ncbi:hypothetical protein NP233_g2611 [Leucocoprinus birnbaumii]|uniref:Uncharacterized protein n=1 Tax=Leucocoprinus birnbaumii TaxID=56174 RepID=A0AAD5VYK9_9AGAR|nr:hypothetical protein NP233_g2611 [Leucocoprinus birnbaumii]